MPPHRAFAHSFSPVTHFLLKILGVKVEGASDVAGVQFALRNGGALGWIVTLGLLLTALAWWSYCRDVAEVAATGRRRLLLGLRLFLFGLLLLLLLRPVLAFAIEGHIRRTLVTMVDVSQSMKIQDPRFDKADLERAAIAKGELSAHKGLDQSLGEKKAAAFKLLPRMEILKATLQNGDIDLFPKFSADFDLAAYSFGQNLTELAAPDVPTGGGAPAWITQLEAVSPATALGDAIREVLTRKRGQPLGGIFLATDGASNTGVEALEAARLARQEGVPLYIYGVGITSPRDIIVGNLFTQDVAFVKDELPVTVRVRGQGLKGEKATLNLQLDEEIVATKELTFENDDEQTIALPFTPKRTGNFELKASIAPREDEAVKDNNSASQRLQVIDAKIKVLYVESAPRWEFRYLQSVLLRDRRLDVKCWLMEGDSAIAEGVASPYIARLPQTKDEFFKFDLIILGDVNSKDLLPEQMEWMSEFVSKFGGSCLFLEGPRNGPQTFRDTPLEKLLPVEFADNIARAAAPDRATALELTPQGRTSPMLRLSPKEDENASIWQHFPRVYWTARVGRAKAAAQVFLEDGDPGKSTRYGKMPVIAFQQYGLGQVLYVGTDNTWRWRRNANDRYYPLLWGQIAQKLGIQHILGGSKRTQLTVDKQSYNAGDRVAVYARLYNADYTPVREATAAAGYVMDGSNARQSVILRAVPEQPGMFRGDFVVLSPGLAKFSVNQDSQVVVNFGVTTPQFELGETAMNEPMLRQMAEVSGGAFFREETLDQLPGKLHGQMERVESTVDAELWSSPFYFALLLGISSLEWSLRKKSQLK